MEIEGTERLPEGNDERVQDGEKDDDGATDTNSAAQPRSSMQIERRVMVMSSQSDDMDRLPIVVVPEPRLHASLSLTRDFGSSDAEVEEEW